MDEEKKVVSCPVCGSKRLKVGQLTYNTQEYDQEQDDWGDAHYCFDAGDITVSVHCKGCSENGLDTELTDLAIEAGWDIYDEDSFKLIPKEHTHEDDMERLPQTV